ncbi:MAG: acyl-CoA thioesterase [Cryobacterium sp.]|nr:acyl-CoA thioesterase [Oligoflexia bacterium]
MTTEREVEPEPKLEPIPSEPLRMVEMVFPNNTNHYGTLFGGKVLDLMDRAAFLAATRFAHQTMVTASTEHIDFFTPVKSGQIVELVAKVVFTGKTSLTVKVDLFSEDAIRKTRVHASQGYFHMVAVNEEGKPVRVPELTLENEHDRAEWQEVKALREFRKSRTLKKGKSI